MPRFNKVLVANRGAVASRVIRALRGLGIRSVAVHSEADREMAYAAEADESIAIGAAPPREGYLCAEHLIGAAKTCRADALHPGYGFLSENAAFAQRVIDNGIAFIGPSEQAIALLDSALAEFQISGVKTNIPAVRLVLQSEPFQRGDIHTGLIRECLEASRSPKAIA